MLCGGPVWASGGILIAARATMRMMKERPLRRKTPAVPTRVMSTPPSEPPTMRVTLRVAELSAMALARCSRSTMSESSACRVGRLTLIMTPRNAAMTSTCQTWTTPV
ncbi:MAG: hypothetical protein K0S78_4300 [Thermomicrobiales bacterium]|nr:hypothetical protein [Thermomicrobiales bacterium]